MAAGTFFKTFTNSDRTTTRTLLHESIPITGTLVSGTYNTETQTDTIDREDNIKTFTHGMFQSIYDYPYLSSSANHLFDITAGYSSASPLSGSSNEQNAKKINIYNQMAQALVGYDTTNSIRDFDANGNFNESGDEKHQEVVFMNFSRLLVKDEIKKGSFSLTLGTSSAHASPFADTLTITDSHAATNYSTNSPAGEFGTLKKAGSDDLFGLVYYQAGIVALASASFGSAVIDTDGNDFENAIVSSSINKVADGIRNRIQDISFNNTTELNSSIYFCRASHNEFNYSSNPTYLDNGKIVVKNDDITVAPRSYVTTVGLYSADNELLAVAKLSEPLKKTPENEVTLRVRLDY
jgi:hypothetical protein